MTTANPNVDGLDIEQLDAIATWLEHGAPHFIGWNGKEIDGFTMKNVLLQNECGTVCCIAGAAEQFFGKAAFRKNGSGEEMMGLSQKQGGDLFMPFGYLDGLYDDPAWAARVIRKLIATGEVDWEGTR